MQYQQQAQQLQAKLNELLSQRAIIDEQIIGLRNTVNGINMGVELQKEIAADADKADEGGDA